MAQLPKGGLVRGHDKRIHGSRDIVWYILVHYISFPINPTTDMREIWVDFTPPQKSIVTVEMLKILIGFAGAIVPCHLSNPNTCEVWILQTLDGFHGFPLPTCNLTQVEEWPRGLGWPKILVPLFQPKFTPGNHIYTWKHHKMTLTWGETTLLEGFQSPK